MSRDKRLLLAVLCGVLFLDGLDVSLVGIGIGLAFPALNLLAANGIAPHQQGIAAAVGAETSA